MKKRMKKLAILALVTCMLTSITACGNKTEEKEAVSEAKSEVVAESASSVTEEKEPAEEKETVEEEAAYEADSETIEFWDSIKDRIVEEYICIAPGISDAEAFKEAFISSVKNGFDRDNSADSQVALFIGQQVDILAAEKEKKGSFSNQVLEYLAYGGAIDEFANELEAAKTVYEEYSDNIFYSFINRQVMMLEKQGASFSVPADQLDYLSKAFSIFARIRDTSLDESEPEDLYNNDMLELYYYANSLATEFRVYCDGACTWIDRNMSEEDKDAMYTKIREDHLDDPSEIWEALLAVNK